MSKILIDSNIIIDVSKGNQKAGDFINQQLSQKIEMHMSTISAMEILFGARNKKEQTSIDELLKLFKPIKLNEQIDDVSLGLIKTYSMSHGLSIPDALIASTALNYSLPLYTNNLKHFQMIKYLKVVGPY